MHSSGHSNSSKEGLFILPAMIQNTTVLSYHMPAHAGDNDVLKHLWEAIAKHGAKLEGTTDSDFHYLGNYYPPTGAIEKAYKAAA